MKLPSHFYAIVDPAGGHEPVALAETMLDAGTKILQLRLKCMGAKGFLSAARAISALCRERRAIFIVNDRVDIALLSDADGVHLGQSDLPLAEARRLMGPLKIIGISTRNVEMARAAEAGGADYIGFGPIYPGGLRNNAEGLGLRRLAEARAAVRLPIVAIGGITERTMLEVLAAGADAAAIITDVVKARDVAAKIRAILALGITGARLPG